jgi:Histone methylation protein DOT1
VVDSIQLSTQILRNHLMNEIESIGWIVLWCKAFPSLLEELCEDEDLLHRLRPLAWESIFPEHMFATKSVDTNSSTKICSTPQLWNESLGYGEILPETVFLIMHWLKVNDHLKRFQCSRCTIFDLGSGEGKTILASALCCCHRKNANNFVGLEILPLLDQKARDRLQKWNEEFHSRIPILFECDDFTKHSSRIVLNADLIWIHATVFEDALWDRVQSICHDCKEGTLFVLISKPLVGNHIETLLSARLPMTWGEGMVFVQRKVQYLTLRT